MASDRRESIVLRVSEFKSSKRVRCLTKHQQPTHSSHARALERLRRALRCYKASATRPSSRRCGHDRSPQLQVREYFRILCCKLPSHSLRLLGLVSRARMDRTMREVFVQGSEHLSRHQSCLTSSTSRASGFTPTVLCLLKFNLHSWIQFVVFNLMFKEQILSSRWPQDPSKQLRSEVPSPSTSPHVPCLKISSE
jgi:hypothetical protein